MHVRRCEEDCAIDACTCETLQIQMNVHVRTLQKKHCNLRIHAVSVEKDVLWSVCKS
jgi:hypothetical protein